jgi:hypothetical protein
VLKVNPVVDDYYGTKISDPYRYMEDVTSPQVKDCYPPSLSNGPTNCLTLLCLLIAGLIPRRSRSADSSDVDPTANILLLVLRSDPFSTSARVPRSCKGATNFR